MTIGPNHNAVVVDVHVDADLWALIASETVTRVEETGEDPYEAYRAVLDERITLEPTIGVDGETRGVEDIDALEDARDAAGDPR
jgi:hypothetical protein